MVSKNRSSNGGDVFSVASWLHVLSRAFGFWPFSIKFSTKGGGCANRKIESIVYVKARDWIWFTLFVAVYIILNIVLISVDLTATDLNSSNDSGSIEATITYVAMISSISVSVYSLIMGMINREDIWRIITTFNYFDNEVKV